MTSLIVIVIGVALVGLSSVLNDSSEDSNNTGLGILMIVIAQLFVGTQFVVEEKLFSNYYLDPLMVVGFEGMWGLVYWAILLPLF